jgi:spore coat protein H
MRWLAVTLAIVCAWIPASTLGRAADRSATHGRDAEPDYRRVFAQDVVNRIDIRMAPGDWQTILTDMQSMAGPSGFGLNVGVSTEQVAACAGRLEASACSAGTPPVFGRCVQTGFPAGQLACLPVVGGANAGGDETELLPRTPVYVPVEISFDGETFNRVGFRLKGNSTLFFTWRRGSDKLPFRLNFDGLESRFPETRDQTFFGFPNLAFTNGNLDTSYLRGKVVTDLFREAGVPAAQVTFVRVYLDRGTGLSYMGVYTMLEVPDRPMLRRIFGSDEGNLYKPHGTGGRWAAFSPDTFPKRTNEEDEDWTDVEDAIAALHASKADRAQWRRRFEARFDVPMFLRWLALNTIMGNVDAYGGVSGHNYYVYGSPRHRDRLFWIPWDHDLAMPTGGLGTPLPGTTLDLFHDRVNGTWPLIRFLMDDPVYRALYRTNVQELLATVFAPARVSAMLQSEQARIFPFVFGPQGETFGRNFVGTPLQFDASVHGPNGLINYVSGRAAAAEAALRAAR